MANVIVIKHRAGTSGDPSGLSAGEIAGNLNDKLFYIGTGAGNIIFVDKTYVDNAIGLKANSADVYTQAQIDTLLSSYSDTTAMNTAINNAVSGLVDAAPGTLNTLNELAAALGDDPDFATTISTQIAGKLSDAPSDTKQYVRQDGAWVEVTATGGLDANSTIDGGTY
jgi:hypothetical protein